MTEKTVIWDRLGKTDPSHTKKFSRAGGFKGTAIKPIYTEHKMTEEFGPCGVGWGIDAPVFTTVPGSDGQVAVYCSVSIWINIDGKVSAPIFGVGGDLVVVKQSAGLRTDDEAFKKAFTDAIGNAMKHLGMSADVHMGLFDDSKYVESLRDEMAEPESFQPSSGATLPKAKARSPYAELQTEIDACVTVDDLAILWRSAAFQTELKTMPTDWQQQLFDQKELRKEELARRAA
jgi:hypothetical protein